MRRGYKRRREEAIREEMRRGYKRRREEAIRDEENTHATESNERSRTDKRQGQRRGATSNIIPNRNIESPEDYIVQLLINAHGL